VVPWVVAELLIFKLLTNGNVKPAEILKRLRAEFGDETLSRIQIYNSSESFKEGRTQV